MSQKQRWTREQVLQALAVAATVIDVEETGLETYGCLGDVHECVLPKAYVDAEALLHAFGVSLDEVRAY